jgi:hypothetical protein
VSSVRTIALPLIFSADCFSPSVNNVGKSYEEPTFFQELPDQDMIDIVEINVYVLPLSRSRKLY